LLLLLLVPELLLPLVPKLILLLVPDCARVAVAAGAGAHDVVGA
jgi:hypothetical protein